MIPILGLAAGVLLGLFLDPTVPLARMSEPSQKPLFSVTVAMSLPTISERRRFASVPVTSVMSVSVKVSAAKALVQKAR